MTGAVAGLLLAAGGGSRFGGPKALVEVGGRLLVERGAARLAEARLTPRVVVLGAGAREVVDGADLDGAEVVINETWRDGMGGSLRLGLADLRGRAPAVVVTLVDQPLIGAEAITRLVAAWREGAAAAVATYGGVPGHPVLLDAALWDDVAASATGDAGARRFLRAHPELVTHVPCDGTGSPADVDTPADLATLLGAPRKPTGR